MSLKSVFFTIILTALSTLGFSQNKLIVKEKEGKKKRTFETGNTLHFATVSDSIYNKGKILDITEQEVTFLLVENDPQDTMRVALDEFLIIRKPTKLHYTGYALGSAFMLGSAYLILEGPEITDNHWHSRGIGVLGFIAGLTPFLINPKSYHIGETHELSIISEEE